MKKIIIIVGPTAVGKSELALELAKKLDGEIINADSMQVYKEMNIGTAKPTVEQIKSVPHHLFNIKSIFQEFSVAEFQELVNDKINQLITNGKVPIIVGGTGLYVKAFLYGYKFEKSASQTIDQDLEKMSNQELFDLLKNLDPVSIKKIHLNNRKRLQRAIQIFRNTGQTKSMLEDLQAKKPIYDATFVGLTMNRENLYSRINQRVDKMIKDGLIEEAELVVKQSIAGSTALQAIGYKEFIDYFNQKMTIEEVIDKIKKNTRNYAKRQYTFFNNQFSLNWFNLDELDEHKIVDKIINIFKGDHNV